MKPFLALVSISVLCLSMSCEKEDDEVTLIRDLTEDITKDIHFDVYRCFLPSYDTIYKSIDELEADDCMRSVLVSLGYEGIAMMQVVKVPYIGEKGSAYEQDVSIRVNYDSKRIYFDYILTTVDTFQRTESGGHSALVLLDGFDSSYEVVFNHEIIPLEE